MSKRITSRDCVDMSDFLTSKGLSSPDTAGELQQKALANGYGKNSNNESIILIVVIIVVCAVLFLKFR